MELEKRKKMSMKIHNTLKSADNFPKGIIKINISEIEDLLEYAVSLEEEIKQLKDIDLTTVHIKGACDEKERWRNKIREKIEKIKEEDLELRETDSEGDIVTKCEQRAVLNSLQDLLKEE